MSPGPGGGGGGGGLRNPLPPRPAAVRTPTPRRISVPAAPPKPIQPAPPPEPLPSRALVAPVVPMAADKEDHPGIIEEPRPAPPSQGPGLAGGAGTGAGSGAGEGSGSGIGEGSGGGTGGGPYRPGSGIEPPRLIREVKATYTDEARRRGVTGDVLLEIVVRRDGSVGNVSIRRGLGAGLDERAVDAVRQWRFAPARRLGTPVDVIVEVAVEFTVR
jgi:TonB family protein